MVVVALLAGRDNRREGRVCPMAARWRNC